VLRIHNRYVPSWLHRLFNAVLVGSLSVTVGVLGLSAFSQEQPLASLFGALLYGSPLLALAAFLLAHRFSIVRGIAGGDGYDELK
jgi:hypothetical protein